MQERAGRDLVWQELLAGLGAPDYMSALLTGLLLTKPPPSPKYEYAQVGVVEHWPVRKLKNGCYACVLHTTPLLRQIEIAKPRPPKQKNPQKQLLADGRRILRNEKRARNARRCELGRTLH